MEHVIEGNDVYVIKHIGSATVKEWVGYVNPPEEVPVAPIPDPNEGRITQLEAQVTELTVLLGDLLLDGGL